MVLPEGTQTCCGERGVGVTSSLAAAPLPCCCCVLAVAARRPSHHSAMRSSSPPGSSSAAPPLRCVCEPLGEPRWLLSSPEARLLKEPRSSRASWYSVSPAAAAAAQTMSGTAREACRRRAGGVGWGGVGARGVPGHTPAVPMSSGSLAH